MISALLTGHRDIHHIMGSERLAVGDRIDTQPGHSRALAGVLLSRRNVVFYRAGDHTCPAARATINIDDHPVP
jgi:hypothetical protein